MKQVDGIPFYHNQFINSRTQLLNIPPEGFGILSQDANFFVAALCSAQVEPCPPANLLKNQFTGLNYGIYAMDNFTNNSFIVNYADFLNNKHGIYSSAVDNVSITNSDFNIGNNPLQPISQPVNAIGIHINTGTNFTISENTIYSPIGCTTTNVGIRIRQTGPNENQVNKNDLRRLTYAIMASGTNRSSTTTGLQILCNHLENNTYAIFVNPDSTQQSLWEGIRTVQGNYSLPQSAGNVFINNGTNQGDIRNTTQNGFYYLYSTGTGNPLYTTPNPLVIKVLEPINPCPSIINNQWQTTMISDGNSTDQELNNGVLKPNETNSIYGFSFVAYPNPASTQVSFSFKLPDEYSHVKLVIRDIYGRIIHEGELNSASGIYIWSTSKMTNGMYIYQFVDNHLILCTGKINIIH